MSSISNTPDIDEKKADMNKSDKDFNIIGFLKSVVISIITIVIYFIIASIILFNCKIAQSNILPTDLNCFPYENNKSFIDPILTNIFVQNTDPLSSAKLEIPQKIQSKNVILDMIRELKYSPRIGGTKMFLLSQLESMFHTNYNILNVYYNLLNQLPELAIVILGPIFTFFQMLVSPVICLFSFAYYYFVNMKWLFKKNTSSGISKIPKWEDITLLEPFNYSLSLFLTFVFIIILFCSFFTVVPFVEICIMFFCVFSMIGYKGVIQKENKGFSEVSIIDIIKYFFSSYKVTIMAFLTLNIISSVFSNLGQIYGIVSIIIVLLIYFNIFKIDLYKANLSNKLFLTQLVENKQATKSCDIGKIQEGGKRPKNR